MSKNHYLAVLAGGSGTRLWPLSRARLPKQIIKIIGRRTLLQSTLQRLKRITKHQPLIITTSRYAAAVRAQAPQLSPRQVVVEPLPRGTAAAIGLAAAIIHRHAPTAVVTIINSDQIVRNEKLYQRTLQDVAQAVQHHADHLVMVGIKPTYPEIGYGYIELGRKIDRVGHSDIYVLKKFREKPTLAVAKKFVASPKFLWNPAIFSATADHWLKLLHKFMPSTAKAVNKIAEHWGKNGFKKIFKEQYQPLVNTSIDYGVMEKLDKALVIPADFGWADIGHWRSIHEVLAPHPSAEVAVGKYLGIEGQGNLIYSTSGRLVATLGIKNMVVVDTADALLICPLEQAQRVKELVAKLADKEFKKYS